MIQITQRPDDKYRTQEQWIALFNDLKQPMISMPNIIQLVKENNIEAMESLKKDFDDRWLVTSTRIIYDKSNLSAKIIHNAGSTVIKQKEIDVKEIPDYTSAKLNEILETVAGLDYCRALIDEPRATKEEITKFLTALSGKPVDKIRFWTPTQSSRKDKQVRSVLLGFVGFGRFSVYGVDWFDYGIGLSRGVIVPSAKQTPFFSNKAVFDIEEKTILIPMQRKLRKGIERKLKNKEFVKIDWNLKVKLK